MALLHLLKEIIPSSHLHILHCNHGVRIEAHRDAVNLDNVSLWGRRGLWNRTLPNRHWVLDIILFVEGIRSRIQAHLHISQK